MPEALARSDRDFLSSDERESDASRLISSLALVLRHPLEILGLMMMAGFAVAIIVNAVALQTGPHPAPYLHAALAAAAPAVPAPAPRPAAAPVPRPTAWQEPDPQVAADAPAPAAADQGDLVRAIQGELLARGLYDGTADGKSGPRTAAAIRAFQTRAGLTPDGQPSADLLARIRAVAAPAPKAADPIAALLARQDGTASALPSPPDKRLLAIEQALARLGYGPLRVDGLMDASTHAAISRFERDQQMPVTGEVSAPLAKALSTMAGMPVP